MSTRAVGPDELPPALRVPERVVPVPASVSPEAQAMLGLGVLTPATRWPALEDVDGWRRVIAERDQAALAAAGASPIPAGTEIRDIDLGDFPVYEIVPVGAAGDDRRVYLDFHGGGFVQGGGAVCRARTYNTSQWIGARVWSVDYRMPPDHPYPAAVTDCVTAYRALLDQYRPQDVVLGGSSAGASLVASTILRARDEGLPLPAAAVMNTPVVDLSIWGDTFHTNHGIDSILDRDLSQALLLYADGHDLRDPYLSPLHGDLAKGFPPTILLSGTRDLLLSDTVRFHRALLRAGLEAELHVFEAAGHGGFLGTAPEDRERLAQMRQFAASAWARGR
ncbi:alpha/beta hydrolase [Parafrankia sp. EUN1f]|uniref:alpha/beta hydrolase n=1 Tax=Parafrankia sp. EUN1f TaxID=102897 RepID=UPI000680BA93|nr:alpha/beta hydrolase [Parafrankia sp. EUN1f]